MESPQENRTDAGKTTEAIDLAVRLGLVALLVWLAVSVFRPFLGLMVWAMVLAIALYPLNSRLATTIGTSNGRAAILLILILIVVVGVPTILLGTSFVDHMLGTYKGLATGTLTIPPPGPGVEQWPIVGSRVYAAWQEISSNTAAFAEDHRAQLLEVSRNAAAILGSAVTTLLAFIGAFIIAGIMIAYAEPGASATRRVFTRICGPRTGPELHQLSVATVRSVASGVIGVAFIQAVLLGIGFIIAGIPAPGLLAVITLLLGIAQVPAALVVIPVVIWMWVNGDASTLVHIVLTIYLLIAALSDNVLKPLLLGRGLAVPMPVVLLGAIGGMITSGLIGLFVGAVILAVAWQLFMAWVDRPDSTETALEARASHEDKTTA